MIRNVIYTTFLFYVDPTDDQNRGYPPGGAPYPPVPAYGAPGYQGQGYPPTVGFANPMPSYPPQPGYPAQQPGK